MDLRVDDHPEPVLELERISKVWRAVHWDSEKLKIADKSKEISIALRRLGFTSLKDWAAARGLDHNISDTEIGSITLDDHLLLNP